MATFDEVSAKQQEVENEELKSFDLKGNYETLKEKLEALGYDVLLNSKETSEFIPYDRFKQVISQRDNYKTQLESINTDLEKLKNDSGKGNEEIQKLINDNEVLIKELEESKFNLEIFRAAKDALNPADILPFIDKDNIKVDKKGNMSGIDEEVERIRKEKPYLFRSEDTKSAGGTDVHEDDKKTLDMNTYIRRMAGMR